MARKRRGRGEGLIRERENGLWEARISLGYGGDGKRKARSVYGKTKAEVQEKLRKLQGDSVSGQLAEPSSLTLGQYLSSWLNDTAKQKVGGTTFVRYEVLVRVHIVPHVGTIKLQKFAPVHINHLMAEIARAGEAKKPGRSPLWSQKLAGTLLHNALRHAVRLRLIPFNPAAEVPRAKPREMEMQFLSREQVKTLIETSRTRRLHALFVLAVSTGMRQGELLGLKWDDIDFEAGSLTVKRSLAQVKGKFFLKEPKSKRSRRTLKLPAVALDALREHREKMEAEGHDSPFAFTTKAGTHISKSNLTRQVFRPALKSAKLPQVRFHDLRHSHCSILLRDGASIKAVSQRLGHSTIELTLRTYFHLLPDSDDLLAGQFDRLVA